jgi:hypothetical protein
MSIRKPARRPHVQSHAITEREWQALVAETVRGAPHLGAERRDSDRYARREVMHLFCGLTWTGKARDRYLVRTRDISKRGVGFIHSQPATRGARCRVAMLNNEKKLINVPGRVASCTSYADGIFAIGVEFDEPVNLAGLVDRPSDAMKAKAG